MLGNTKDYGLIATSRHMCTYQELSFYGMCFYRITIQKSAGLVMLGHQTVGMEFFL